MASYSVDLKCAKYARSLSISNLGGRQASIQAYVLLNIMGIFIIFCLMKLSIEMIFFSRNVKIPFKKNHPSCLALKKKSTTVLMNPEFGN